MKLAPGPRMQKQVEALSPFRPFLLTLFTEAPGSATVCVKYQPSLSLSLSARTRQSDGQRERERELLGASSISRAQRIKSLRGRDKPQFGFSKANPHTQSNGEPPPRNFFFSPSFSAKSASPDRPSITYSFTFNYRVMKQKRGGQGTGDGSGNRHGNMRLYLVYRPRTPSTSPSHPRSILHGGAI